MIYEVPKSTQNEGVTVYFECGLHAHIYSWYTSVRICTEASCDITSLKPA